MLPSLLRCLGVASAPEHRQPMICPSPSAKKKTIPAASWPTINRNRPRISSDARTRLWRPSMPPKRPTSPSSTRIGTRQQRRGERRQPADQHKNSGRIFGRWGVYACVAHGHQQQRRGVRIGIHGNANHWDGWHLTIYSKTPHLQGKNYSAQLRVDKRRGHFRILSNNFCRLRKRSPQWKHAWRSTDLRTALPLSVRQPKLRYKANSSEAEEQTWFFKKLELCSGQTISFHSD